MFKNKKEWKMVKVWLKVVREKMQKTYFSLPIKKSGYCCLEETLLRIFEDIYVAEKEVDQYILSDKEWDAKYYYGGGIAGYGINEPEDLRDDWPHAMPMLLEAA